jgi:branched-chain amino acid transport system permease protein
MMNLRVAKFGFWKRIAASTLGLVLTGAVALSGAAVLIEMVYHRQLNVTLGSELRFLGLTLDVQTPGSWFGAAAVTLVGFALFEVARRRYARRWGEVQGRIERIIKHREEL